MPHSTGRTVLFSALIPRFRFAVFLFAGRKSTRRRRDLRYSNV